MHSGPANTDRTWQEKHIYIYIYTYYIGVCISLSLYIYIYREREKYKHLYNMCIYIYIYVFLVMFCRCLPGHYAFGVSRMNDFQTTGTGTWKHLEHTQNVCSSCFITEQYVVAIFYPFSQFCELNMSLLSLQKQPNTAPNLFQRGVEYGKYAISIELFWVRGQGCLETVHRPAAWKHGWSKHGSSIIPPKHSQMTSWDSRIN